MRYTIYKCDICEKEVDLPGDLISVKLPRSRTEYKHINLYEVQPEYRYNQTRELEICEECAKKIVKGYRKYLGVDIKTDKIEPWVELWEE